MSMLWEIGKPASSMDVAEKLLYRRREKGEEPASFATVTTTLRRLAEKGVLTNRKGESRTQMYAPTVSREDMAARILNNVSVALLGQPLHGLLPKLVGGLRRGARGADEAEQAEITRLMQALEEEAHIPASSVAVDEDE